jgi:cell wall-associated NlpC family hydrolase
MLFNKKKSDEISQALLGMSFEIGGRGPEKIDCYGVLKYFYNGFGLKLPDYSYVDDWSGKTELYLQEYAKFFRKLDKDEELEIGDMILFSEEENTSHAGIYLKEENTSHAGIYLGESRFIHAYDKAGTRIDSLTNPAWKKKIYGFFRITNED